METPREKFRVSQQVNEIARAVEWPADGSIPMAWVSVEKLQGLLDRIDVLEQETEDVRADLRVLAAMLKDSEDAHVAAHNERLTFGLGSKQ